MIVKGSKFIPAPAGIHNAVCVDVVDLGLMDTKWGKKEKLRIVWEIEEKMPDGKPFLASQMYTASLNEQSNLFAHLNAWRGRPFTDDELEGFELEKVIGAKCQLVIVHATKGGRTYANVQTVVKAQPTNRLLPSGGYVRVKDRPTQQRGVNDQDPSSYEDGGYNDDGSYGGGDDIPF